MLPPPLALCVGGQRFESSLANGLNLQERLALPGGANHLTWLCSDATPTVFAGVDHLHRLATLASRFRVHIPREHEQVIVAALGVLPLSRFLNGHTFFVQHAHTLPGAQPPISVHMTYQFGEGAKYAYGKRQRHAHEQHCGQTDRKGEKRQAHSAISRTVASCGSAAGALCGTKRSAAACRMKSAPQTGTAR